MRFRVKSAAGNKIVNVDGILENLIAEIYTQQLVGESDQIVSVKHGFPPKPISLEDKSVNLEELGLRSGDQLIVEASHSGASGSATGNTASSTNSPNKLNSTNKSAGPSPPNSEIPNVYGASGDTYTILRNVPDDNSCLFNSIIYAKLSIRGEPVQNEVQNLRNIISSEIGKNPVLYDELVLGRPVEKYREWILKKDSWGGAIEIGILTQYLEVDIHCLDVESGKFIKFENNTTNEFIVLVYSGIHYDVMAQNSKLSTTFTDKQHDKCVFRKGSADGIAFLSDCERVCKLLQTQNYSTNTTTFRVRCLECYEVLVGEMGASNHANSTGHFKFGEVK